MKKFLLFTFLILLLGAGGIGFMMYKTIDAESYKKEIIEKTKELIGQEMFVNGDVHIELLPSPVITLNNVDIKNKQDFSNTSFLKIEKVQARIQFLSLFKNPLIIENVVFLKPQLFLQKNENGRVNWELGLFKSQINDINNKDLLYTGTTIPPFFQHIKIVDGKIFYDDKFSKIQNAVNDIQGELSAISTKGPFDFEGNLKYNNVGFKTTAHIDVFNAMGDTGFTLGFVGEQSGFSVKIKNGKISRLSEPSRELSGQINVDIPRLSQFLIEQKAYKDLPLELDKQILGEGQFKFSAQGINITEMAIHYGSGSNNTQLLSDISIMYPTNSNDTEIKRNIKLQFVQVDAEPILSSLSSTNIRKDWNKKLMHLKSVLPANFSFYITADKILATNTELKDLKLKGNFKQNLFTIEDFFVILPQDAPIALKGSVDLSGEEPAIVVAYRLLTKDFRPTYEWLQLDLPFIDKNTNLTDFEFLSRMKVSPNSIAFDRTKIALSGSLWTGEATFDLNSPSLKGKIDLDVSSLNVDNFIPYQVPEKNRTLQEWLLSIQNEIVKSRYLFSGVDLILNITGKDIAYHTLPIENFSYKGTLKDNIWTTETLKVNQIATANFNYSGTVTKVNEGLEFGNVSLDVELPKTLLLLERMKITPSLSNPPSKLDFNTKFSGNMSKINLIGELNFTQGKINVDGVIENPLTADVKYDLKTKISYPNFHQFVRLFLPDYKGFPNLTGILNAEGLVHYEPNSLRLGDASVSIGAQQLTGALGFRKNMDNIKISGKISSPQLFLEKFLPNTNKAGAFNPNMGRVQFSKNLIDLSSLDNLSLDIGTHFDILSFENVELKQVDSLIKLDQKILTLDNFKAMLKDKAIQANLSMNNSVATPFLKLKVKAEDIPVSSLLGQFGSFGLKQGSVSFDTELDTKGNSIHDMVLALSGQGSFEIKNGIFSGLNIEAFEKQVKMMIAKKEVFDNETPLLLNKVLTVGETPYSVLKGSVSISNGILKSSDILSQTATASTMTQLDFDLADWKISSTTSLSLANMKDYPAVSIFVKGSASKAQTNIDMSSFLKYIKSSAADAHNEIIRQHQEEDLKQRRLEAADRIQSMGNLLMQAQENIQATQEALKLAKRPEEEMEFIRVKDAYVLLDELAKKETPSEADLEKASIQASFIATRTKTIQENVFELASRGLREKIENYLNLCYQKMASITRVEQRLAGVEQIEQAYHKALNTFSAMQKINNFAQQSTDLGRLNELIEKSQEALDIIDLAYQSIARFDIDAVEDGEENVLLEEKPQLRGLITRKGQ